MQKSEFSVEDLQAKVLAGLSFALGVLTLVLTVLNIVVNHIFLLSALELIFSIFSFFLFFKARKKSYKSWQKTSYLSLMLVIILYASSLFSLERGLFFWMFGLPTIFYLLLGIKRGFCFTLLAFLAEACILYFRVIEAHNFSLVGAPTNFTFCYLTIWVVSHVYESNRNRTEASLYRLAHTDNLTGAYNRLAFEKTVNELLEKHTPFYLHLLDVDYFKKINDQYGHETGDDVLKQLVIILSDQVGSEDVYRYGGEEFCLVDRHSKSIEQSVEYAEAIRRAIEERIIVSGNRTLQITASFGIAEALPKLSLDSLISQADLRMYKAKSAGRNRVVASEQVEVA